MAAYFFDSSALAKAYRNEAGTKLVMSLLEEPDGRFLISSLTLVELQSTFAQKVRSGDASLAEFHELSRKFGGDIRAKRITVEGLFRRHLRAAEKLIARHAPTKRLRTLDAVQLAVAIELRAESSIDHFVVADAHLAEIAISETLPVINPDKP